MPQEPASLQSLGKTGRWSAGSQWRPRGAGAWLLIVVACLLTVLMAGLAYCMVRPVRWDGPGKFGGAALFFPLHLLAFTLFAAVLAFLAKRAGARLAAWVFGQVVIDRKSTRLNSSHPIISYAVFCLKKNRLPAFGCRRNASERGGRRCAGARRCMRRPSNCAAPDLNCW